MGGKGQFPRRISLGTVSGSTWRRLVNIAWTARDLASEKTCLFKFDRVAQIGAVAYDSWFLRWAVSLSAEWPPLPDAKANMWTTPAPMRSQAMIGRRAQIAAVTEGIGQLNLSRGS